MLDRDEVRGFFTFLDTASDREIEERKTSLETMSGLLNSGSDARKDVQFLLRKLNEERAARINLAWCRQQRKAQQA